MDKNLKIDIPHEENKKIYLMQNPKALLNRYFLKNKNYIKVKIRREIILGIPNLIFKIIFKRYDILKIYKDFPKKFSLI